MGGRHRAPEDARRPRHRVDTGPVRLQVRVPVLATAVVTVALAAGAVAARTTDLVGLAAEVTAGRLTRTETPDSSSSTSSSTPSSPVSTTPDDALAALGSDAALVLGSAAAGESVSPQPAAGPPLALTSPPPRSASSARPGGPPVRVSGGAIPAVALAAYRNAAAVTARLRPGCRLDWQLLAAIGAVESAHGTVGGSQLGADGVARPAILGPRLDGHLSGTSVIGDSDGGRLDGDPRYDRAIGPMQFLPRTWAAAGVAARPDSAPDPQNVRDAALAAAGYLCRAGGDLSTAGGRRTAVLAYNASQPYVDAVLGLAARFAGSPPPVGPPPPATSRRPSPHATTPKAAPTAATTAKPSPAPTPTQTTPSPSHSSKPSPSSPSPSSPSSASSPSSISATSTTPTGSASVPGVQVTLAAGEPGVLTARWAPRPDSAVTVALERLDADGDWQPVDDTEVTIEPGDRAEHRWDVEPGRYRAVLQPLDRAGEPVRSDEVTVTDVSGAPTP